MQRHAAEDVFALLDREIWLLTCSDGEARGGLVATLVSQASIVPDKPRVWVGLSPQHHSTSVVLNARSFLLQLVDASQSELVWKFGTTSGHDGDKFTTGDWQVSESGHPRLPSAIAWLECRVESQAETGDRIFFLCQVVSANKISDQPPLTVSEWRKRLTPSQLAEVRARLMRDSQVDAEMIRRWKDAGYRPLAIEGGARFFPRNDPGPRS